MRISRQCYRQVEQLVQRPSRGYTALSIQMAVFDGILISKLKESSQLRSLCFLVSAHIINKCPFHGLICAPFLPHIFVLSLAVLLFKKALLSCAGVLLGVSEHKRP